MGRGHSDTRHPHYLAKLPQYCTRGGKGCPLPSTMKNLAFVKDPEWTRNVSISVACVQAPSCVEGGWGWRMWFEASVLHHFLWTDASCQSVSSVRKREMAGRGDGASDSSH